MSDNPSVSATVKDERGEECFSMRWC